MNGNSPKAIKSYQGSAYSAMTEDEKTYARQSGPQIFIERCRIFSMLRIHICLPIRPMFFDEWLRVRDIIPVYRQSISTQYNKSTHHSPPTSRLVSMPTSSKCVRSLTSRRSNASLVCLSCPRPADPIPMTAIRVVGLILFDIVMILSE